MTELLSKFYGDFNSKQNIPFPPIFFVEGETEGQTENDEVKSSPKKVVEEAAAASVQEVDKESAAVVENREEVDVNQFTFTPGHHPKTSGNLSSLMFV